jgi:hypothetical protein
MTCPGLALTLIDVSVALNDIGRGACEAGVSDNAASNSQPSGRTSVRVDSMAAP